MRGVALVLLLLIIALGGPVSAVGLFYAAALIGLPVLLYRFVSRRV